MKLIIVEFVFFWINICIALYQAHRFDFQQKRINHTVWGTYYTVASFLTWFYWHNWLMVASLLLMHLPLFNTALNFFRVPRKPLFYTHPEDPLGSRIDKFWSDWYPAVFFLFSISYIIILFFI